MSAKVFMLCTVLCGLFMFSVSATAGGNSGDFSFGLSVVESSPNFMFKWWVSEQIAIEPNFGIIAITPPDGSSATRVFPGLGFTYNMRPGAELRPYLGARLEFDMITGNGSATDILCGPVFGAQYFLSDHFAIGGEYQLVLIFTDDKVSPSYLLPNSTYITSSQLLSVHFYF